VVRPVSSGVSGSGFTERIVPLGEEVLPEAASILTPSQSGFGVSTPGVGSFHNQQESWQGVIPSSGNAYEIVTGTSPVNPETGEPAGQWTFWIVSSSHLPFKASVQRGTETPQYVYYEYQQFSYQRREEEAGNLPPTLFLPEAPATGAGGSESPPESRKCLASGVIGGWQFDPAGSVYPDPAYDSVLNGPNGDLVIEPTGAAVDGREPRAELVSGGLEVETTAADAQALHWDFNAGEVTKVEQLGANFVIETSGGEPLAIVEPTSGSNVKVIDNVSAAEGSPPILDEIVLDPTLFPASATISPVPNVTRNPPPCITKETV